MYVRVHACVHRQKSEREMRERWERHFEQRKAVVCVRAHILLNWYMAGVQWGTSLVQCYRMAPVCLLGRWWISPTLQHEVFVCVYICVCACICSKCVCVAGGRACLSAVLTCSFEWVIIACSVAGPRHATLCICVELEGEAKQTSVCVVCVLCACRLHRGDFFF